MTFHSEYGQDKWLAENIWPRKRNGVFVEFGALDGILHSNTLYFERERGWHGLLMEPNPFAFRHLPFNRPDSICWRVAVYDEPGEHVFEAIDGGLIGWSGLTYSMEPQHQQRIEDNIPADQRHLITVPCISLDKALFDAGLKKIDYLSIDTEGAEERILRSFPFSKYEIDVIGVEDNFGNPALADILIKADYQYLARIGVDQIWRRGDKCTPSP